MNGDGDLNALHMDKKLRLLELLDRSNTPVNRRRPVAPNLLWLDRNINLVGLSPEDKEEAHAIVIDLLKG